MFAVLESNLSAAFSVAIVAVAVEIVKYHHLVYAEHCKGACDSTCEIRLLLEGWDTVCLFLDVSTRAMTLNMRKSSLGDDASGNSNAQGMRSTSGGSEYGRRLRCA